MSLPKQQLPIFTTEVPSTGGKYTYRPFTVKEEKALALAQETKEDDTIFTAIAEVLNECFHHKFDARDLAIFDVEYLLTQVRAKSVGEMVTFRLSCDADPEHERTPYNLDITKHKIEFPKTHAKRIDLFDDVGVVMRYPKFSEFKAITEMNDVETIALCIDFIYEGDQIYKATDHTMKERIEFIESLSKKQKEKIEEIFFKTIPIFEVVMEWECMVCKHQHKKTIRGIHNFFI